MDAKESVAIAKTYIQNLFATEGLSNLGLEEVEFDDVKRQWAITIGFSRSWDVYKGSIGVVTEPRRTYKKVLIDDGTKAVTAVRNRDVADA